jgi:hypothetical protein
VHGQAGTDRPFEIPIRRARISKDQGRTWDDEVVLRDDGGTIWEP